MRDCLIVCENRPGADILYKYLLNHLASFGVPLRTERRIRSVEILTTEIRVVTTHEYYTKCKFGFHGKVITEAEARKMIDEDKQRLNNIKKGENMKKILLGDEKISVAAFEGEDDFAIIAFVKPKPGEDIHTIPLEDHEVAICFKTKKVMNAFISHLIEVKKYIGLECCDEDGIQQVSP